LPIYWSLQAPDKLSQYPATWVAAMANGTGCLFFTYAMVACLTLMSARGVLPDTILAAGVWLGLCAVPQAVGMWMLSRHSGHWTEPPTPFVRLALRASPVGPLLATVVVFYWAHLGHSKDEPLFMALMLVGVLGPPAVFVRLRTVARLIADAGLAEHSAIVGHGFFVTTVVGAVAGLFQETSALRHGGLLQLLVMAAIVTAGLLFLIWGAFIMFCCLIDFGRAAKVAHAEWTAAGEGSG
jgi:hypothetical protein